MAIVELKHIDKIYPNGVQAVFDFNLRVEDGEFLVLVGPSGCGKSTTLRMIAGLEGISAGDLVIDGSRMNSKAPVDRDIAMVFQNYALYGHMTVYDNMGISLKVRHEDKIDIFNTVSEAATKLDLTDFLNRLPANLSGGQRQRVALGRTIVRNPRVFLMDEPLSNLDAKLREKTRSEIVRLQKSLGTTTVYVTHDQIEAMTMADRIVIMKDGYIQQVGTPHNVYHQPNNLFVAGFIGTPTMNFIECRVKGRQVITSNGTFDIDAADWKKMAAYDGQSVILGVRPESIDCDSELLQKYPNSILDLAIDHTEFLGKEYYVKLQFDEEIIVARIDSRNDVSQKNLKVTFDMTKVHFFDKETTKRICEEV